MKSARIKAYFDLLIVVVIWGIAPTVIKFALNEIPPFLFLFYRFLITIVILLPFYLTSKKKGVNIKNIIPITIASFLASTATLGLLFYGTNLTTSLDASLISATSPIVIIFAGALFLKEHITKKEKIGILVTIIGTFIVSFQGIFEKSGIVTTRSILGNALIFASNITFAASLMISKNELRKGVSAFSLMFYMFFIGFITIIPFAANEVGLENLFSTIFKLTASAHLSVLYMAVFSGAIAYYLYQRAQKTIETSEAAIFLYLQPVITAPVAMIWLKETMTPLFVAGCLVIAIGVLLAELKKKRYN